MRCLIRQLKCVIKVGVEGGVRNMEKEFVFPDLETGRGLLREVILELGSKG